MSVPVFNGLNFSDSSEQVQFHLGVLDLDLAIRIEKPADITDDSSNEKKNSLYDLEKVKQTKPDVFNIVCILRQMA